MQRRAQVEPVVFWQSRSGELMLAPHTGMKPFLGWARVECTSVSDIERFSRRMAAQEEAKLRGMKIEEHLRSVKKWESIIANCKLRLAQGCISANDELVTKRTIQNMERNMSNLAKLLTGQIMVSESALEIERHEKSNKRYTLAGDQAKVMVEA